MELNIFHILGILLSVGLLLFAGLCTGKKVKNANDFNTGGGKAGAWMVCGAIMGTLVGGQTTMGTAQLAFAFGIEAWWFAIGSTLGCILLAFGYCRPLRHSGSTTLLEILGKEYGKKVEALGSLLSLLSIFISILAQIIAAAALLTSFFDIPFLWGALISAALMVGYVVLGGVKGAGLGGLVKLGLLYISCLAGGIAVWGLAHGFGELMDALRNLLSGTPLGALRGLSSADDVTHCYSNIIARGPLKDLGSALSLTLGVICTQTYAQGIWAGRSNKAARKGALLSALLIPPIGAASILIGMYVRANYITVDELAQLQAAGATILEGLGILEHPTQAFPVFVIQSLPDWFGGIVLGTLLVTVIGSGSGLALGASSIVMRDILRDRGGLLASQLVVVGILLAGVIVALLVSNGFMNDLGFLSLGLRATAILIPLSCALWFKERFSAVTMMASMILGCAIMLAAHLGNLPGDSMFYGLAAGFLPLLIPTNKHSKI